MGGDLGIGQQALKISGKMVFVLEERCSLNPLGVSGEARGYRGLLFLF